jgi:hypothetical protein
MSLERLSRFTTSRDQARHGATPIRDHDLAALGDLVEEDG